MKPFWEFRNRSDKKAELILYGDISQESWFGDEITPKQFAKDLSALGDVDEIDVRINSGGGDVFAAQAIGNLLEQHQANVTARLDGLCASAATIVACHCNKVVAAKDSIYMVHPVKLGMMGYIDAAKLKECLGALETIRGSIVGLYARKTGRYAEEVGAWMDNTSWWTSEQAMENGFVDALMDDAPPPVVENRGGVLFVNNVSMGLPFQDAPKFGKMQNSIEYISKTMPAIQQNEKTKEVSGMEITTLDGLKSAFPELANQLEQAALQRGITEERQRIQDIEEMSIPGCEELTNRAKFSEPMNASEYAKAAMKLMKQQGAAYLNSVSDDAQTSGANDITSEPAPIVANDISEMHAQAKADARKFLERTKGGKKSCDS